MKKASKILYALFAAASYYIRNFAVPNPFDCFGDIGILINWIAEPIIHGIAFSLVGLVYQKGEAPLLGSILYLATYWLVVLVLMLFGVFRFAWWWILILVVAFIAIVIGIRWVCNRWTVG